MKLTHHNSLNLSLELEYVGQDLAMFTDEHNMSQLSDTERYQVWIDISRAIEYIHSQLIIHQDVKPQNILFDKANGRAVLCDFGISTVVVSSNLVAMNGGTPCYIPPEYITSNERGFAGDIWAFGITMLFAFSLIPLPRGKWKIADILRDDSAHKKMFNWLQEVDDVRQNIPEYLSLLHDMLLRSPRRRITASDLVVGLLPRQTTTGLKKRTVECINGQRGRLLLPLTV